MRKMKICLAFIIASLRLTTNAAALREGQYLRVSGESRGSIVVRTALEANGSKSSVPEGGDVYLILVQGWDDVKCLGGAFLCQAGPAWKVVITSNHSFTTIACLDDPRLCDRRIVERYVLEDPKNKN